MLPASNRGAGQCLGFPDVCNTPAGPATVPIPYPNIGMNAQAQNFSQVVKVSGVNAMNIGAKISQTMGDEAGTAHPTTKGAVTFTQGDFIVSIDKLPAVRLTSMTTQNQGNNPVGAVIVPSAVNVTFCRAGKSEGETIADEMCTRSVASASLLPGHIGLLRLTHCGPDLVSVVQARVQRWPSLRGLILDLRGNPGGCLDAAVALSAEFLPHDAVVAHVHEADGTREAMRSSGPPHYDVPLAVLVDGHTASAAELIAACLGAHGRAVIVGERTYGKARAARLGGAAGTWLGPSERSVAGVGVCPDLETQDAQRLAWGFLLSRR